MQKMKMQETNNTKNLKELLSELVHCNEKEQQQKINEINRIAEKIEKEEIESAFTKELFDKMHKMIEEKKMSMENVIVLLKRMGYLKGLKDMYIYGFDISLLKRRIEKMIFDEDKKKIDVKNEKLLVDLCECYLTLVYDFSSEFLSICVPCLLKFALNKEESEKAQNEVEMALLALSSIRDKVCEI
ncbi:uncharacterized protein MONOS_13864 [Monocercomonoides exilis]|uniref:uncharacterized protein n=1 Tax=Monocercomonoides exilis TaxID=2049356 RepID=UPI003559774B|nr:hypothetical protein MONOS_13864 [Monocercomonoides exilis]|eukprot:MONOS_13864.1-p1 / transcript=MONOS_13864.1 / gene=MONOS_13864 / organism=Monocercomonoides_exilis_PA203 / gene_product=unspecified product / transcript_product=unspecified product / location=Mono_scaffold00896:6644-7394(-) / protein_length=186 / sequence_SO=supercontig / SO=protein_coding / is_pseudo=false